MELPHNHTSLYCVNGPYGQTMEIELESMLEFHTCQIYFHCYIFFLGVLTATLMCQPIFFSFSPAFFPEDLLPLFSSYVQIETMDLFFSRLFCDYGKANGDEETCVSRVKMLEGKGRNNANVESCSPYALLYIKNPSS